MTTDVGGLPQEKRWEANHAGPIRSIVPSLKKENCQWLRLRRLRGPMGYPRIFKVKIGSYIIE